MSYRYGNTGKGSTCVVTTGNRYLNRKEFRDDNYKDIGKPIVISNIIELSEGDYDDFNAE